MKNKLMLFMTFIIHILMEILLLINGFTIIISVIMMLLSYISIAGFIIVCKDL